ncbi:growth hormone-inducible transmembrane protein-like [Cimex lectularius]|uniref:Uncharacterized protein n=1 Tax=Cimex lectularius TaxID=79782 RepID=A0A8I6RQ54_CIMLE|nr:growth hormone-inducible transmembrane protein-like [Cimex lectularius]
MLDLGLSAMVWYIGKVSILILFMVVSGATIFWAACKKSGALFELDIWPECHKQNLITTYFFLCTSYIILTIAICLSINTFIFNYTMSSSYLEIFAGGLMCLIVLSACIESLPYEPEDQTLKISCWLVHSLTMAPGLSSFGSYVSLQAMVYTSFGIVLASLAGFTAPQNLFQHLKYPLKLMYIVVGVTTLFSVFVYPNYESLIEMLILETTIFGGMILYFVVTLSNTQGLVADIKNEKKFDPIFSAAVMFLSTINLYIRIGMFVSLESSVFSNVKT